MDLIVESTGESSMEADVLELVTTDWADLGIKVFTRTSQRDIFRSRVAAGSTLMSVWAGVDNGAPTADFSPQEFVPTDPYQLQWPMWGTYVSTHGSAGEKIDYPNRPRSWSISTASGCRPKTTTRRERSGREILDINAEEVFSIGIVTATLVPVVVSNNLMNVPAEGISSFDPYGYFGVYEMDSFWMKNAGTGQLAMIVSAAAHAHVPCGQPAQTLRVGASGACRPGPIPGRRGLATCSTTSSAASC